MRGTFFFSIFRKLFLVMFDLFCAHVCRIKKFVCYLQRKVSFIN